MQIDLDAGQFAEDLAEVLRQRWMTDRLSAVPNFWDIVEYGRESYEIRNSKMLRWLLDPNGSHGLQDRFVIELVSLFDGTLAAEMKGRRTEQLREVSVELEVPLEVVAGSKTARGRLDLLYLDKELGCFIAIENKTGTSEHAVGASEISQTRGYLEALQAKPPAERGFFVYLAPEGDTAEDELWSSVSHQALFPTYARLAADADRHTCKLIEDFFYDLSRKLDSSLDADVGEFLFADYSDTVVSRLTPSNSLWGVMALLPAVTWAEPTEKTSAADQHYLALGRKLAASWPAESWAGFAADLAAEFEHRGLDVGRPVTPDLLQRAALVLWEHRPMKMVDHSTDETVRDLIRRLFTHFTRADAEVGAAEPTAEFAALGDRVAVSRGKMQGIQFDLGPSRYKLQGSARSQAFELMSLSSETGRGSDVFRDRELGMRRTTLADWGFADGVWDGAVLQDRAAELVKEVVTSRARVIARQRT